MYNLIDPRCGKPFVRWKRDNLPKKQDMFHAADFEHLDGRSVQPGEAMTCDSCSQPLDDLPVRVFSPFDHPERWVKIDD